MGFSSFDVSGEDNTVSFDINFAAVNGGPQPSTVTVPLVVDYESRMRFLCEKEIECKLKETGNKDIATYSCESELKSPNIKNIKIIPNFTFPGRKNANVVGSTPLANMFMDNLQNVDDSYDNLICVCRVCHSRLTPTSLLTKKGISKARGFSIEDDVKHRIYKLIEKKVEEYGGLCYDIFYEAIEEA